jgi:hypothetical protein
MAAAAAPARPGPAAGGYVVKHWRVFGPGLWNGGRWGRPYGPRDIAELVRNYRRFSDGPAPFYVPFVSVNHEDRTATWADGEVTDCGQDPDGWFWIDLALSREAGEALNAGKIRAPSIEFWDTRENPRDRHLSGFPEDAGMVLRAATLLGARAEGAKGQGRPPAAVPSTLARRGAAAAELYGDPVSRFADLSACIRRFSEDSFMGRDQIIQAIVAACPGLKPETLAGLTDEQLAAMAGDLQQGAANPPPADPAAAAAPPPPPGQPMMDDPAAMAMDPNAPPADPTKMMADVAALRGRMIGDAAALRGMLNQVTREVKGLASTRQLAVAEEQTARKARVRKFLDESAEKFTPLQRPMLESWLLSADAVAVRKFADQSASGTELDERMAQIRAWPKLVGVRRFSDQTDVKTPGHNPDRVARLMNSTETLRAIAREQAAAAK